MSTVLLCANPLPGHVTPMLGISRELVAAGMTVRFLTGRAFAGAVAQTGAAFIPLPVAADALQVDPAAQASSGPLGGLRITIANTRRMLVEPIPDWFHAIDRATRETRVDVIIGEVSVLALAAMAELPRGQRPGLVACGITTVMTSDRNVPPAGLGMTPRRGRVGQWQNAGLRWLATRVLLGGLHRRASTLSKSLTGAPLSRFLLDWPAGADVYAQMGVESFEYPRATPGNVVYLGPVPGPQDLGQLPEWWADLEGERPVIHVAQGTLANADLDELIGPTLRALADDDVLLVVTTGRAVDDGELGPLPANVRVAEYIDYRTLMPHVDVFVTNGGFGSIHAALRHGVPIVVAGNTEDKAETSARVQWSGVGVNLRTRRPGPEQIHAAVHTVLTDPSFSSHARRIAADIAASPGPAGLVPVVHELIAATHLKPAADDPAGGRAAVSDN